MVCRPTSGCSRRPRVRWTLGFPRCRSARLNRSVRPSDKMTVRKEMAMSAAEGWARDFYTGLFVDLWLALTPGAPDAPGDRLPGEGASLNGGGQHCGPSLWRGA